MSILDRILRRTITRAADAGEGPAIASRTYVVVAGDTLSKIAKREYGDFTKWERIYQANRAVIKKPSVIHPGQVLVIPDAV
jgi:nucleoid-associated protein YgaU